MNRNLKIQTEIKAALRMPLIYLVAAIAIAIGMLLFVFPNITGLFQSFEGAELPGVTQFFLNVGVFLKNYAVLFFGSLFVIIMVVILLNK